MKSGRSSLPIALAYMLLSGGLLLSGGCATPAPQPVTPDVVAADAEAVDKEPAPTPHLRPFSPETLYSLLTAEIAGSRQQYQIALNNYAQQAKQTRDPQVAERATIIARYLNAHEVASESAMLWAELAPENPDALANATVALMQNGQLLEAFAMSQRLQEQGQETLFQSIAANAGSLTGEARETLLTKYEQQLALYPADEQLLIGTGLLHQLQGRPEAALTFARRALRQNPRSVPATLLDANLLHQLNRTDEATKKMAALLDLHPDNLRLRLQYARILAHYDLQQAKQQFDILVRQNPEDPDLLLSLALVALEAKDLDTAVNAFESLLNINYQTATANFYSGQIAELRNDLPLAVIHYMQVEPGEYFSQATVNLIDILVRTGDLLSADEHIQRLGNHHPQSRDHFQLLYAQALVRHDQMIKAESVLDNAILEASTNTSLLYTRAMLYEKQDLLPAMERDLRRIIQLEPDNVMALNTLGYILVDRTDRFDEARPLLRRAITLKPEDPAIIDSVGWLYFRTGNYPEALAYLRRAFALYPDAEIAAHLGEVLWVINERDEALTVWNQGLQLTPDSDIIKRTMERLQVPAP